MFILVNNENKEREFRFVRELNILEDIYDIDGEVWVIFVPNLRKPDGTKVRGGYGQGKMRHSGDYQWHIIYIDDAINLIEAATVLIHEYAHILSQQNHGFTMYELWRSYLRKEFRRRWEDVIGEKDTDDDRGRVVVVGEVCNCEQVEHVQDGHIGCGQKDCQNECSV
jgi:hypothetical protein